MEHDFHLFDVQSWRRHLAYGRVYHYLWAVIFILLATWFKINFSDLGANLPFSFFFFSVFLSAYIGGLGPGLLALVSSTAIITFFFLPPNNSFAVENYLILPTIAYIVECVIIVYLLTKQRRLLFQKIELDRQKDDFISASSHELNTPLTSMKIYLGVLEQQVKKNKHIQYEDAVDVLTSQTERLIRLVGGMLDITRLKANKAVFKQEEIDVTMCAREVCKTFQKTSPLHKIHVDSTTNKRVLGDDDRISQVVSNLLTNAIKYSPKGGDIFIAVHERQNQIQVSVKDQGIGISKDKHKRIFDRFYRVSAPSDNTFSGLGIGLYLSAEIIQKHGGHIWVESEKGQGSTFYFTLPTL
ncbi:MAG: cell wall metabolism sensor histidine kinase WalK [bacterium]|nr:cell wall metabolism sensor histidine kinase WalK [bacterium]